MAPSTSRGSRSQPFNALLCPKCGLEPQQYRQGQSLALRCENGHSYDLSKHGVLNLMVGSQTKFRSDTQAMLAARERFLAQGYYQPVAAEVSKLVVAEFQSGASNGAMRILDLGCGTGYYAQHLYGEVTQSQPELSTETLVTGIDLSPVALRVAVRHWRDEPHSQLHNDRAPGSLEAIVWDVWQPLPVAARSHDVALMVFAPRPLAEVHRVLRANGVAVIVTAEPDHLHELSASLTPRKNKAEEISQRAEGLFSVRSDKEIHFSLTLGAESVSDLLLMGPNGHHLSEASLKDKVQELTFPLSVTVHVRLHVLRRLDRTPVAPRGRAITKPEP